MPFQSSNFIDLFQIDMDSALCAYENHTVKHSMTQALKPTANTTAVKSTKLVETGKLLKFLYEQSLARSLNSV